MASSGPRAFMVVNLVEARVVVILTVGSELEKYFNIKIRKG
jgi:hypothetical protein